VFVISLFSFSIVAPALVFILDNLEEEGGEEQRSHIQNGPKANHEPLQDKVDLRESNDHGLNMMWGSFSQGELVLI